MLRDSRSLLTVLLMPLMLMSTLGYGVDLDTKHIRVFAYDREGSQAARICSSVFSPPTISIWSIPSRTIGRSAPPSTTADASSRL